MSIITKDNSPLLVAEIGINHNGSLDIAKTLVDLAAKTGFHAVKFQKREIDSVYTKEELDQERITPFGTTNRDLKNRLEFSLSDYIDLTRYCRERGLLWSASPWDVTSVQHIKDLKADFIKLASACVTDKAIVDACIDTGLPIFISTGMCSFPMIETIVSYIQLKKGHIECLYHCTSTYPTDLEEINLNAIEQLQVRFPDINVGYSGHEIGILPSVIAVALGAKSVERHITLSRKMFGSDQSVSLEPNDMEDLSKGVQEIKDIMGDGIINIYESEKPIIEKLRKKNTLVTNIMNDFEETV